MDNTISPSNWYELDFSVNYGTSGTVKIIMEKIYLLIQKLKEKKLLEKWFFLYEPDSIRVRFKTSDTNSLKLEAIELAKFHGLEIKPGTEFKQYSEGKNRFTSKEMVERFANIMAELSDLTIGRLHNKSNFNSLYLAERLCHCILNNIYTFKYKEMKFYTTMINSFIDGDLLKTELD